MRRTYLFIVVVFGMATVALAQTTSPDSKTLLLQKDTGVGGTIHFKQETAGGAESRVQSARRESGIELARLEFASL
jgi:hypothetical protein